MISFNTIFPNLVSEPSLLGPPLKHDCSFIDREHDMKKGLLTMRHGPDIRGQSSAEPPLISRPPVPAYGGWLVEDDISNRTQTNNWPFASAKESNVSKSEKHQAQPKPFSHRMEVSASNVSLSQASQLKAEEVCRWMLCCFPFFTMLISCPENVAYMQATSGSDFQRQNIPPKSQLSGIAYYFFS
jgi:RNA polymerase II C-terminal domain phosphatase-like 1/2